MRALLIALDSVGIGDAPEAEKYGDDDANTFRHIFEQQHDLLRALCSLGLPELIALVAAVSDGCRNAMSTSLVSEKWRNIPWARTRPQGMGKSRV